MHVVKKIPKMLDNHSGKYYNFQSQNV